MATAVSRVASKKSLSSTADKISRGLFGPWLPNRVRRRCPATILAAKRTERVKGRMTLLTISINTINGIKAGGVPKGTK